MLSDQAAFFNFHEVTPSKSLPKASNEKKKVDWLESYLIFLSRALDWEGS